MRRLSACWLSAGEARAPWVGVPPWPRPRTRGDSAPPAGFPAMSVRRDFSKCRFLSFRARKDSTASDPRSMPRLIRQQYRSRCPHCLRNRNNPLFKRKRSAVEGKWRRASSARRCFATISSPSHDKRPSFSSHPGAEEQSRERRFPAAKIREGHPRLDVSLDSSGQRP
jgi:hypothetical protein